MQKAKLIKLTARQKDQPEQLGENRPGKNRPTQEIAKEWVNAFKATERPNPRKQFAALFT